MGARTPGLLRRAARNALGGAAARGPSPLPKAHFLHIGKTGGGSVKVALESGPSSRYEIRIHPHTVTLADIPAGEGVFFFLRDPVSRFVSAFNWQQKMTPTRSPSARRKAELAVLAKFPTPGALDSALADERNPLHHEAVEAMASIGDRYSERLLSESRSPSSRREAQLAAFAAFPTPDALGSALADERSALHHDALEAMASIGHLRNHYSEWLGKEDYLLSRKSDLLFIGLQEQLSDDFEILTSLLSLPDEAQLPPSNHEKTHKALTDVDTSLSRASRDVLRDWYAEDYRLLETSRVLRTRWVPAPESPR
jgi:hypothetical protein